MLNDIVKTASVAALLLAGGLAGCSAGGQLPPAAFAAQPNAQARTLAHADAVVPSCADTPCSQVEILAPLQSAADAMGIVYVSVTAKKPTPMQVKNVRDFVLGKITIVPGQLCAGGCKIAVSSETLEPGPAMPSVIEGPVEQSKDGTSLTLHAQDFKLPPGSYYFYLAQ